MNDKTVLYSLSLFRVLFVIIVLFYTSVPEFIKIFLLMISDGFELCRLYFTRSNIYKETNFCSTNLYQHTEKNNRYYYLFSFIISDL